MEFSAFLIPSRIIFRDCPLGEKPTSIVDWAETETASFDWVRYTVVRQVTKANTRKRLKADKNLDFVRDLMRNRLMVKILSIFHAFIVLCRHVFTLVI